MDGQEEHSVSAYSRNRVGTPMYISAGYRISGMLLVSSNRQNFQLRTEHEANPIVAAEEVAN